MVHCILWDNINILNNHDMCHGHPHHESHKQSRNCPHYKVSQLHLTSFRLCLKVSTLKIPTNSSTKPQRSPAGKSCVIVQAATHIRTVQLPLLQQVPHPLNYSAPNPVSIYIQASSSPHVLLPRNSSQWVDSIRWKNTVTSCCRKLGCPSGWSCKDAKLTCCNWPHCPHWPHCFQLSGSPWSNDGFSWNHGGAWCK